MQTQLIEREAVRAKFSVSIPATEVDKTYETITRKLAREVKVPGFRPGKAPIGVIKARIGKETLAQEVRDELLDIYYPQAVSELELTPIHVHFHAHEPVENQDYSFEVEVDLYPEFDLPKLEDIVIDTEKQAVSEEQINETVESLRRDYATLVPVERPVEPGDYLIIESLGETAGSTMPIDLEKVDESFAAQFLGKSSGDEIALTLDGPERKAEAQSETEAASENTEADNETENEANSPEDKGVVLNVVIRDIKEKDKLEVDDDFAKTLGFDSWEETTGQIRKSLQAQLDQETFEAQREEFIDKLTAESEFEVPKSLISHRKRHLLENLSQDLKKRGLTLKAYIEQLDENGERETFDSELDKTALTGAKRDLVLEKLLDQRGTIISNEEFNDALNHLAQHENKTVNRLRKDLGQDWLNNYRFMLTRDKAVRETLQELLGEDSATQDAAKEEVAAESADEASEESKAVEE